MDIGIYALISVACAGLYAIVLLLYKLPRVLVAMRISHFEFLVSIALLTLSIHKYHVPAQTTVLLLDVWTNLTQ